MAVHVRLLVLDHYFLGRGEVASRKTCLVGLQGAEEVRFGLDKETLQA